jgi:hypothetical protein
MSEQVDEYKTCDMYQAASLMAAGCKMSRYTAERGRVYFHLDNRAGLVSGLVREYLAHRLQVDALSLVDHARSLKSLCGELTGSRGPNA